MPITKFAAAYGIHPTTVWRALKAGRLQYVIVGKRKLVVPPPVQKTAATMPAPVLEAVAG
jgi:hypothetical protein